MWYAPKLGDKGLKVADEKQRVDIWKEVKSSPVFKMDCPVPWYPDSSGYEVCIIRSGKLVWPDQKFNCCWFDFLS